MESTLKDVAGWVAENKLGLFTFFPLTLTVVGNRLPRAVPGRAITLALTSLIRPPAHPVSARVKEVSCLRKQLSLGNWDQSYLAVTGPKGVGKSCLISTAVSRRVGVVSVSILAGESTTEVSDKVMRAVANLDFKVKDPWPSFQRVVLFHWLFTFGKFPVVVLNLGERRLNEPVANITSAVRTLADKYHMRVILDASPNSLDPTILATGRCTVLNLSAMTDEDIAAVA